MDFAVFSPRKKQQILNQSSPRFSAHKRSLFPTNSPQSNDLGHISELSSDNSDTFSPSPLSPSSSVTPEKSNTQQRAFGRELQISEYSKFDMSSSPHRPTGSPKVFIDKENIANMQNIDKKRQNKFLDTCNFEDHFVTVLPASSEDDDLFEQFNFKSTDNFTTPKKTKSLAHNKSVRKSPHSIQENEVTIKPNIFYGNIAPLLTTNQTNRIQGMKCVFRPSQPSRAKAKLLFEEKPPKKRERSKSLDATREAKRRKTLYTGVNHAIPKPVKPRSPPSLNKKRESVRDKARKITDLSRTPFGVKKPKKNTWEYTLRFTKPLRYEEELSSKRKFFKTSVKESSSPGSSGPSPNIPKKRKLLDTRKSYLDENSPKKPQLDATDISDMINDLDENKLQIPSEVDDILLRLDDDDSEELKRKAEKQMLMNILEDSPNKTLGIDSLANYTASLDLNTTSSDSRCCRVPWEFSRKDKDSPAKQLYSVVRSPSFNLEAKASDRGSSKKKKWQGMGKGQLQIDAGQKQFGACQCSECGMIYQKGEAEDETYHNDFHNNLTNLRHTSWKNENVVGAFGIDYAVVVTGNDPKSWQQKALEVITLVDKSLGIISENPTLMHNQKVFLYLAEKRIVGCMVACPISHAYRLEGSESDVNLCSQETFSVRCGISRMWTLYSYRKQGVATRLLDTVRRNFMYGYILSKEDIAFSIPTPDGKKFATKYMGSPNFFVYTGF